MSMLKTKQTKKSQQIYTSLAFYRNITYLKRNKLLKSKRMAVDSLENQYFLTLKGDILARILAGLTSAPEEYRKHSIV